AGSAALQRRSRLVEVLGTIVGPGSLLLLASTMLWLTLRGVRSMARVANRLAGNLQPHLPHTGRRDEIGAIARALAGRQQAAASERASWQFSPIAMLVYGPRVPFERQPGGAHHVRLGNRGLHGRPLR